jgi:hypothetical protein
MKKIYTLLLALIAASLLGGCVVDADDDGTTVKPPTVRVDTD